jgi:hypothetical protein
MNTIRTNNTTMVQAAIVGFPRKRLLSLGSRRLSKFSATCSFPADGASMVNVVRGSSQRAEMRRLFNRLAVVSRRFGEGDWRGPTGVVTGVVARLVSIRAFVEPECAVVGGGNIHFRYPHG